MVDERFEHTMFYCYFVQVEERKHFMKLRFSNSTAGGTPLSQMRKMTIKLRDASA